MSISEVDPEKRKEKLDLSSIRSRYGEALARLTAEESGVPQTFYDDERQRWIVYGNSGDAIIDTDIVDKTGSDNEPIQIRSLDVDVNLGDAETVSSQLIPILRTKDEIVLKTIGPGVDIVETEEKIICFPEETYTFDRDSNEEPSGQ